MTVNTLVNATVDKTKSPHPLDGLTAAELSDAVSVLKKAFPGKHIHFKNVQAQEPPKKVMIAYLNAERAGDPVASLPRMAYAYFYVMEDRLAWEMWIDLNENRVVRSTSLPKGTHPPMDQYEADREERIMMEHPEVLDALRKLGLTDDEIKCVAPDGWMYGCDSDGYVPRYLNYLMYMRDPKTDDPESNVYAFPLPFVPVMDIFEHKFVRIDWCATGGDGDPAMDYNTRASGPILDTLKPKEYYPSLMPDVKMRTDLKPYNVLQPQGPSFTTQGNLVNWQKWSFRVGFTPREGLVLHDVRYEGRQTFYRLSVSEMTVPYGDPRPPLHRKQAFDLGDIGAGYAANSLGLGCDCLGTIKYFDCNLAQPDGSIETRKNVVCMHEQDDGILWKHTNYRTENARVARRRVLVLQTILTVANYEYIFAWHFDQAANIDLEIRATGIVSTQYIDPGKVSRWGTVVNPSVLASSHQHIFSMRIDPAVDGEANSVAVCETALDDWDENNPHGTGFYNKTSIVEKSTALDCDQSINRYLKIVNENKINPITKQPIGYKLSAYPSALLFARPGSIARKRAEFATHHFWITKYQDNELYGGGIWTNQASKEIGGVKDAVSRRENVRNDDIVLWHSFGLTHHPRIEDWPVMPAEIIKIGLHPNGFFTENPAIDVPPSNQAFNRSVEVMDCRGCRKL